MYLLAWLTLQEEKKLNDSSTTVGLLYSKGITIIAGNETGAGWWMTHLLIRLWRVSLLAPTTTRSLHCWGWEGERGCRNSRWRSASHPTPCLSCQQCHPFTDDRAEWTVNLSDHSIDDFRINSSKKCKPEYCSLLFPHHNSLPPYLFIISRLGFPLA